MRTVKSEPAPHPTDSLPSGWAWGRIEDLVGANGVYIDGDWVESKDQDPNGDVRLIQLADVGDGYYVNKSNRFLTSAKARELGCTFMQTGDVLIARMPDPLGRACIFPGDSKQAVTVVDVCIVRCGSPDVDHQWLMNAVNAPAFRTAIGFLQSGSTRARISRGNLSTLWLPVPPSKEQQRIVAALDERLSELDASMANLERAERNLVRYRASVLAAACSGKLVPTEAFLHGARPSGPLEKTGGPEGRAPGYEPADQLLARILTERRKANTKAKYEEPAQPDTSKLPKLPEGWVWATVDQLTADQSYGSSAKTSESPDGIPVLRMGNIQDGKLDTTKLKYLPHNHHEFPDLFLEDNDLLFNRTNSAELVGKAAVYQGHPSPCSYASYLIRVRFASSVYPHYLCGVINSSYGRAWIRSVMHQQVGQANVNGSKLAAFAVPLPPRAEQERIVAEVDRHLSRADALDASIAQAKRRAQRLRRAILAAAFQGRLVPQDPNDEPASVLLDRIRAQVPLPGTARGPRASTADSERARGARSQEIAPPIADAMTPKRRGRPPGAKNKAKA